MENRGYGRVYTYRKEDGMGYGVYDPEKVFFILDPEGKVYINDRRCSIIKKGDLPPCEAMTLRFKFSDPTYDPVVAGVGTGGTWKQVTFSPNIWDWTRTNTGWQEQFKEAFGISVETEILGGNTTGVTNLYATFQDCVGIKKINIFDTSELTNVEEMFSGCRNVEEGALALYQQMSTQENPPTTTTNCFLDCGADTPTGSAELAQIPSSWGGTGA